MTEEKTVIDTRDKIAEALKQYREEGAALRQVMRAMAETIGQLRSDVQALRGQVAQLEKLTPMQTRELNARIQERARVLSIDYCVGDPGPIRTLIRRALRMETGCRSAKDIPRCDWQVAAEIVDNWEEPKALRALAER